MTPVPPATPGGQTGARWVTAGLLDQAVIASTNAGTVLLAGLLLDAKSAGVMLLSLTVAYVVVGLNREFVGSVLVAMASRYSGERRDRLVRNGLAAALSVGGLAAVLLIGVWAFWPTSPDLGDLIWVAPFLPMILLYDTGRYSYLADRRPSQAVVIDLFWVGAQAVAVLTMVVMQSVTAGGLLVAWGLGATAGACVFLFRSGERPWRGDPRRWASETRSLSGWFTTTALIGQIQVLTVTVLVGLMLGEENITGLRLGQVLLLQPIQNFNLAMMGLLVPRASRLAHAAGPGQPAAGGSVAAAAGLRRQTRVLATSFGATALLMVAVVWPVATTALPHVRQFVAVVPLALPISIQAGCYLVQTPFQAALRGMHRARLLFAQYVMFTTVSLTGLVLGALAGRLPGAVWGLTAGSVVGLVVMIGMYLFALRGLGEQVADAAVTQAAGVPAEEGVPTPFAGTDPV